MTPKQRYLSDLNRSGFYPDQSQQQAVDKLQDLYERLLDNTYEARSVSLYQKLRSWWGINNATTPVRGLYFWGGVGRGKTYLMDAFYDSLPFERKMRAHFHRFMQRVHRDLKRLDGEKNPLTIVAEQIASEAQVICFDEFFVSDITDAMILAGLFEQLFARGVTLVATSNIIPDDLYKDGLQRNRFLPAIALLNQHTEVVNVDGGVDYRLRVLEKAELYHCSEHQLADAHLQQAFDDLNPDREHVERQQILTIEGRDIQVYCVSDDVAWFEFEQLCDGPRSQNDYIELAKIFHAVLVGNVPQMGATNDDQARRFINLVDEFYDRNVKLVLSASVPLQQLYAGGRLDFEFERTKSRLLEMQSHDYLARAHKP